MDSTSDERTANNLLRHQYRVLSDEEKIQMEEIKDLGVDFVNAVRRLSPSGQGSREQSIAITKIEEAVMWSVKFITKEDKS